MHEVPVDALAGGPEEGERLVVVERDADVEGVDLVMDRSAGYRQLAINRVFEVVGKLAPSVVIPIHAALPIDEPPAAEAEALSHFLAAMGVPETPAERAAYVAALEVFGERLALHVSGADEITAEVASGDDMLSVAMGLTEEARLRYR